MGEEIDRIKTTTSDIAGRIAESGFRPDLRFALVSYRDQGDEFVTHAVNFTDDVQAFQGAVDGLVANGCGDFPEALNEALHEGTVATSATAGHGDPACATCTRCSPKRKPVVRTTAATETTAMIVKNDDQPASLITPPAMGANTINAAYPQASIRPINTPERVRPNSIENTLIGM